MVLCAAETKEDGSEKAEFVEPPEGGKEKIELLIMFVLHAQLNNNY